MSTKAKRIKPGLRFTNGGTRLTVLCFTETANTNLALLFRPCDGFFITVRNLTKGQGVYFWDWGHYYDDIHKAAHDYELRKKDL
ncbi:hypothetical protein FACS1894211_16160 [Clostridia bacterium]|nr:hypothetical protein FACS1894211_16160 [Clostridia bacterium]